jgi:hypothetical protein
VRTPAEDAAQLVEVAQALAARLAAGEDADRLFSREDVDRIVSERVARELRKRRRVEAELEALRQRHEAGV